MKTDNPTTEHPHAMKRATLYGYYRITRRTFWRFGGLSNPDLIRVSRGRAWAYYCRA